MKNPLWVLYCTQTGDVLYVSHTPEQGEIVWGDRLGCWVQE